MAYRSYSVPFNGFCCFIYGYSVLCCFGFSWVIGCFWHILNRNSIAFIVFFKTYVGKVFFKTLGKLSEARIIGRISMDNIICDVTNIDGLKVGDLAFLIDDFYTLDDMGRDAGTISYEILSRVGKNTRYIRRYID